MKAAIDDYQTAAQMFCEQEDWDNYQKAIDSLKTIQAQVPSETTPKLNNQQLRQRLLRLVGGYWEIAERLIDQAKAKYPGRTEQWYWETVIANLETRSGFIILSGSRHPLPIRCQSAANPLSNPLKGRHGSTAPKIRCPIRCPIRCRIY
jgi:hypothetical protein